LPDEASSGGTSAGVLGTAKVGPGGRLFDPDVFEAGAAGTVPPLGPWARRALTKESAPCCATF
jgi:hypothetical protein